jgi:hypothetical protein
MAQAPPEEMRAVLFDGGRQGRPAGSSGANGLHVARRRDRRVSPAAAPGR